MISAPTGQTQAQQKRRRARRPAEIARTRFEGKGRALSSRARPTARAQTTYTTQKNQQRLDKPHGSEMIAQCRASQPSVAEKGRPCAVCARATVRRTEGRQ